MLFMHATGGLGVDLTTTARRMFWECRTGRGGTRPSIRLYDLAPLRYEAGWIMATRPSNRARNLWTVGLLQLQAGPSSAAARVPTMHRIRHGSRRSGRCMGSSAHDKRSTGRSCP
jgi:hypothetical protein